VTAGKITAIVLAGLGAVALAGGTLFIFDAPGVRGIIPSASTLTPEAALECDELATVGHPRILNRVFPEAAFVEGELVCLVRRGETTAVHRPAADAPGDRVFAVAGDLTPENLGRVGLMLAH